MLDTCPQASAPVKVLVVDGLSSREREVLHLTVSGATGSAIARQLSLSTATVATYRGRIMDKLGVTGRTALIRFAIQHALAPV
jgi:two-component system response regulator NreC